jgi:hypothetical protein
MVGHMKEAETPGRRSMERIRIKKPKTRRLHAECEQVCSDAALADAHRAAERGRALQDRMRDLLEELQMLLDEIG